MSKFGDFVEANETGLQILGFLASMAVILLLVICSVDQYKQYYVDQFIKRHDCKLVKMDAYRNATYLCRDDIEYVIDASMAK